MTIEIAMCCFGILIGFVVASFLWLVVGLIERVIGV